MDHAGQRVALDVASGLPDVAHLCAGRAVDVVEQLHLWLTEKVGLPRHLSRGPSSLGDAGGHHGVVAPVDQSGWAGGNVDLWLHCLIHGQRKAK